MKLFQPIAILAISLFAGVGIAITVTTPISTYVVEQCLSDSPAFVGTELSEQYEQCVVLFETLAIVIVGLVTYRILGLFASKKLIKIKQPDLLKIVVLYVFVQLLSFRFIQLGFLLDIYQADEPLEFARSYWFALDPVVFFLLSAGVVTKFKFKS